MCLLAFIMGVWPLVSSKGAGSEMRHAMGIAVFSGMIGVTVFGLLLTPVFFTALRRHVRTRKVEVEVEVEGEPPRAPIPTEHVAR